MENINEVNETEIEEIEDVELDSTSETASNIVKIAALGISAGVTALAVAKRKAIRQWFNDKKDARLAKKGYVRVEVLDHESDQDDESTNESTEE